MADQSFSLGVAYWPRRRAGGEQLLCSWGDADPGALRDEIEHIADLGFDTLRLELRWAEAQPGPARVGSGALRGLERALDLAHSRGLRAVVGLMSGALGGALHLPEWAVGFRLPKDPLRAARLGPVYLPPAASLPPILAGDRYRREPVRDLYADPELREAERYLLREVVGYFAPHPAVAGWILGAEVERARRAPSAAAAAAWWGELADYARRLGARGLFGSVSAYSLSRGDTARPEQLHAAGAALLASAAPLPPLSPRQPWRPAHATFLHALVAGLLREEARRAVPVIVADLGLATAAAGAAGWVESQAFGRPAPAFLAEEERQAELVEAALAELRRAGAGGAWLAGYADLPPGLWGVPPADSSWPPRSWGIVAPGGREKPAAAAVRAFAQSLRAGAPAAGEPPALPIDPERYWRDPARAFRELAAGA